MKEYAYQLDTLRLVAILGVFGTHCSLLLYTGEEGTQFYHRYFAYGGYAVSFFIILSGMLSAYNIKPFDIHDKKAYIGFIKKKALRLFPLHWVCMVMFLPFSFLANGAEITLRGLIPTALLLHSCHRLTCVTINGPSWTISVLFIFFMATPWLMTYIRKVTSLWACILLLFITNALNYELLVMLQNLRPGDPWFYYSAPHCCILFYLNGLLLGHMFRTFPVKTYIRRHINLLEIPTLLLLWYVLAFQTNMNFYIFTMETIVIMVFFTGGGWISKFLSLAVFRFFSKLTFSIYLSHILYLSIGLYITEHYYSNIISLNECIIILLTSFVITLITSYILYELVEKRLTKRLSNTKLFSNT